MIERGKTFNAVDVSLQRLSDVYSFSFTAATSSSIESVQTSVLCVPIQAPSLVNTNDPGNGEAHSFAGESSRSLGALEMVNKRRTFFSCESGSNEKAASPGDLRVARFDVMDELLVKVSIVDVHVRAVQCHCLPFLILNVSVTGICPMSRLVTRGVPAGRHGKRACLKYCCSIVCATKTSARESTCFSALENDFPDAADKECYCGMVSCAFHSAFIDALHCSFGQTCLPPVGDDHAL